MISFGWLVVHNLFDFEGLTSMVSFSDSLWLLACADRLRDTKCSIKLSVGMYVYINKRRLTSDC